jgi:hypothetical protein
MAKENFLKIVSVFLLFCYYLPLENDAPFHLNTFECNPPNPPFVPSLVKISSLVLKKKSKLFKFTNRQMDGQMDNEQKELSAQVS